LHTSVRTIKRDFVDLQERGAYLPSPGAGSGWFNTGGSGPPVENQEIGDFQDRKSRGRCAVIGAEKICPSCRGKPANQAGEWIAPIKKVGIASPDF
jgi:hypothetical protein